MSLRLVFRLFAYAIPALIAGQLFLVGLAVFSDGAAWGAHRALGGSIALPIIGVTLIAWTRRELRDMRGFALALLALYVLQFVWLIAGRELGSGIVQAMHGANAMLLVAASLGLASRCSAAQAACRVASAPKCSM